MPWLGAKIMSRWAEVMNRSFSGQISAGRYRIESKSKRPTRGGSPGRRGRRAHRAGRKLGRGEARKWRQGRPRNRNFDGGILGPGWASPEKERSSVRARRPTVYRFGTFARLKSGSRRPQNELPVTSSGLFGTSFTASEPHPTGGAQRPQTAPKRVVGIPGDLLGRSCELGVCRLTWLADLLRPF